MTAFPDTSFLCALYRSQVNSDEADRYMSSIQGALTVSTLLMLEFRQSVRLQIHLRVGDRTRGIGRREGDLMLRDFQSDILAGVYASAAVDWADVHHRAEALSDKHTALSGHRLIDILHVATAMHLGADEFLTFDLNQRKLAEAEGLKVPL